MRKYFLFLSLLLVFHTTLLCSAESTKNIEQLFKNEEINSSNEKEEIESKINNSISDINKMLGSNSEENSIGKYSIDDAYKVYDVIEPDIMKGYTAKGNFEGMISENYVWKIPTNSGYLITAKETDNNNWEIEGVSDELKNENLKKESINITQKSILTDILNNTQAIKEVSNIKYVVSGMYHTTFAYIKADNMEYLVPYGTRPDLTGLENGEVYPVEKAIDILSKNFKVYESNPDANGGSYAENTKKDNVIFPLLFSFIILLSSILVITVVKRKKRTF